MMIPDFHEQFDLETVSTIEMMIICLKSLDYPVPSCRYYALELCDTLRAGALLASLLVSTALLEASIRGKVMKHFLSALESDHNWTENIEQKIETHKQFDFAELTDILGSIDVLKEADVDRCKEIYRQVRVPLHHGLAGRLTNSPRSIELMRAIFGKDEPQNKIYRSMITSFNEMENHFEDEAIPVIKEIIEILMRMVRSR